LAAFLLRQHRVNPAVISESAVNTNPAWYGLYPVISSP
jgi:hypothetical protein